MNRFLFALDDVLRPVGLILWLSVGADGRIKGWRIGRRPRYIPRPR